ncbi:MAG: SdrD B-like domain-containing protein [Planctomycetia bacterium]|nr:SdrD B-like domain-containing protein [Planctomycetia bacterium]
MRSTNKKNMRYRRLVGMEALENRCLLSVNPIEVGVVYYESAPTMDGSGTDVAADTIYVAFSGGVEGTQLTELTIDMDSLDVVGGRYSFIDLGDDNPEGVTGSYSSVPLTFSAVSGEFTVTGYTLTENNTKLVLTLTGFEAGDVLGINCDVDEVLFVDSSTGLQSLDAEVTGAEYSLTTKVSAKFEAEHYHNLLLENVQFADQFQSTMDQYNIPGLPNDDFTNQYSPIPPGDGEAQRIYTAGAFASEAQTPIPCDLSGFVYEDVDYSWDYDPNIDVPIENVTIQLWKLNASTGEYEYVTSTQTDENGEYAFTNLDPGTYQVVEIDPVGYKDVTCFVGNIDGVEVGEKIVPDKLTEIVIQGGQSSVQNDFSEYRPASISGKVWLDVNLNNLYDEGIDTLLEGVQIDLLDADGNVLETTKTAADGTYQFDDLIPDEYGVFEHQPDYLNGGQYVGTVDGEENGEIGDVDEFIGINLLSNDKGINYDYWEYNYCSISGYVFQDGNTLVLKEGEEIPSNLYETYTGEWANRTKMISGVKLYLADAEGNVLKDANGNEISTTTDANGYYEFTKLTPGTYTILEEQPTSYHDGVDTPGSEGGETLAPTQDMLYNIDLNYGDNGTHYDFSEIQITWNPDDPDEPHGGTPQKFSPPAKVALGGGGSAPVTPYSYTPYFGSTNGLSLGGGAGGGGNTFHLASLNGGVGVSTVAQAAANLAAGGVASASELNGAANGIAAGTSVLANSNSALLAQATTLGSTLFDVDSWEGRAMNRIKWLLSEDGQWESALYGIDGAQALTGDFNGDGKDELAIFLDGFWFIDINGNRTWDDYDLWVQLGGRGDQAIVGDWDGDGKADIGVYGHPWKTDTQAIAYEYGLPDAENLRRGEFKNIPPERGVAGYWYSKHTKYGEIHRDVIDHVFQIGSEGDIAVAGDWNGDGISTVGVFNNGTWTLDTDGDGRITSRDKVIQFGQKGDIPVVGNWDHEVVDGKAVSKIGVYRDGTWILDVQGKGVMDSSVRVVHQGKPGELPIVGDFNGTGTSELATYRNLQSMESVEVAETAHNEQ